MSIGSLLTQHAKDFPKKTALVFHEQRYTFAQLNENVNKLAHALIKLGIKKGDKVATVLSNSVELIELYWAVGKTGAVIVPMSPLLRGKGLSGLIQDSDAVLLITQGAYVDTINKIKTELVNIKDDNYIVIDDHINGFKNYHILTQTMNHSEPSGADIQDDDIYNIFYSSGTTGLPKGIMHTHHIRLMYCTIFLSAYRINPDSVILHTGAIIFNGAFLTLMPAFYLGCQYILHKQFEVEYLIKTIKQEQVTHLMLVPSQIVALLSSPNFSKENLGSLQMIGSVGAPLHLKHKQQLNTELPGRFTELYGLTEGFMTILDSADVSNKMESVGKPPESMEMKIVDDNRQEVPTGTVGEIVGRGPLMMPGYYKKPDLTADTIIDGWLYSGDLGYVDEDGFLYLADRKKDLIISGGVNVYPRDIEEVIVEHMSIKEVAVFGIPSEKWGETPVAAVILKEDTNLNEKELKQWINEHVDSRFQKVSDVLIMQEFPRNSAGKTLKREIKDQYLKK